MTVVEGTMLTVVLNIDTGILVGNLTLMVTDGTTSMSMFNSKFGIKDHLALYKS